MKVLQHESVTMFRFVLQGELTADRVREFEHAWTAARSILGTKALVVEISGIVLSSLRTVASAEKILEATISAYFALNKTIRELHEVMKSGAGIDPLKFQRGRS